MSWFVYILLCDQKTFYIGSTFDVAKRLEEHRNGYTPFTRQFSDIQLVFQEKLGNVSEAKKRERQLKGWSIAKKKALINRNIDLLKNLSKSHEFVDAAGKKY